MKKITQADRQDAIKRLRKLLKPGATVYTVLRHRSASGMYRVVDVYIIKQNTPLRLSWSVALATDAGYDTKHEGVKAPGCGLDVGFQIVYNLGAALWPKGTKKPHGTRNGEPDTAGGYALNHRWI
jgi:hypothetical protein